MIISEAVNKNASGEGFPIHTILAQNSSMDKLARLSDSMIVGKQILIKGPTGSSLVDIPYYETMLASLNINGDINDKGDHALTVVKQNGKYIMTNVDNTMFEDMDLICYIPQDFGNLKKIILPSLVQLHTFFTDLFY